MKKIDTGFLIVLSAFVFISCSDDSGNSSRSFYMGFTPWPYAATLEAIEDVYDFINSEGDIIAHHFQQGIPFTATNTLDFNTYNKNIQNEIDGRIAGTASGKVLYLAIDSLNSGRDDLTDLWEENANKPRPAPWDTRGFADVEVITAYVNFSLAVIDRFVNYYGKVPEYFNYGTEVSDLMINSPGRFADFVVFAQTVYASLKAAYPSMKLMVSIALKSPGSAEMATVQAGFAQIRNYVDVVGISTYAYAFYSHPDKGNPATLPANWLTQISTIAPGKPYGVTETGWIAEDLEIPFYGLSEKGSEAYQDAYLEKLFQECDNDLDAEMIILFTSYDYDTLWVNTLGSDNLSKIWKDTGLISETFTERSALSTWRKWKSRSKR